MVSYKITSSHVVDDDMNTPAHDAVDVDAAVASPGIQELHQLQAAV
jgi:hypothetical protein